MEKPIILVTHPLPEEWIVQYRDRAEFMFGKEHRPGIADSLLPYLVKASGMICLLCDRVDKELLEKMENLQVISNMAAGTDNIDLVECLRRKIKVGNTPDVLTNATADLTMALLLALTRNIIPASNDARSGMWQMWEPAGWLGVELSGKTMGIYGMGKIGKAVAERARAFGMSIIYHNRNRLDVHSLPFPAAFVEFEELLTQSDVISIHAPYNEESNLRFNQNAFEKMKQSAMLINVGRG